MNYRFIRGKLRRNGEVVAECVQFFDGTFVVRWLGVHQSTVVWPNATTAMVIHNHDGNTILEWVD